MDRSAAERDVIGREGPPSRRALVVPLVCVALGLLTGYAVGTLTHEGSGTTGVRPAMDLHALDNREFIERCVGDARATLDNELLGLREGDAVKNPDTNIRVIGRDGACVARTEEVNPGRINLIVRGDLVIWAGRF